MSVRLHSLKTPAIVVASLAVVYLLFGWLALPRILDSQARQYIAKTGHHLTVDRPVFNPFNLKLRVSNLRLEEPDGKVLLAFRDLTVDLSASSLFRRALVFDAIRLDDPQATVVLKPDGQLNWSALIKALAGKEERKEDRAQGEATLPRFAIDSFIMSRGHLDFADDKTGFSTRITPLDLELNDISSLPNGRDHYRISARSGTARMLWEGQTTLNPLKMAGSLAIEHLELSRLGPYVEAALPVAPSGVASVWMGYRAAYAGGRFDLLLENVAAKLTDFRLKVGKAGPGIAIDMAEAVNGRFDLSANKAELGWLNVTGSRIGLPRPHGAEAELLQVGALRMEHMGADIGKRSVTVERIAVRDGRFKAIRNAKGRIDVVDALAAAAPPVSTEAKPAALPWHYRVDKVELSGSSATFHDEAVTPAADLTLDDIAASVAGISDNLSTPLPIQASAHAKDGGQLTAEGQVIPAGPMADLHLKVSGVALKPAQPYITSVARLRLTSGQFGTEGNATYGKRGARYTGDFAVRNLRLVEAGTNDVFLAWGSLGSRRLEVTPAKLDIGKLAVVRLYTRLIINKDKSVNINDILGKPQAGAASAASAPAAEALAPTSAESAVPSAGSITPAAESAVPAAEPAALQEAPRETRPSAGPEKKAPSFLVSIDRVSIAESEMDFADHSLVLPFETHIHDLRGFINGLSSRPATPGQIELDGAIDDYGVARGIGQIELFNPTEFTDITVMFSNVEMIRLSPYSTTFAGRKIDSGKLLLNLEYKIKRRKLEGENKIIIDKVMLGERVKSPEAMDLPLDLAVAILQDSEGRIDLGVPVTGSLDDPEFSYGSIVWKAILNIFKMIATAPFRALSALFGSGVKIENVYFDPGAAKLSPPEQENIIRLAGVLNKRPGLSVTVHGTYSDADRVALQDLQLRRAVAAKAGIEVAAGEDPGPLSTSVPKVQAALESLFADRIGGGELDALKRGFRQANPGQMEEGVMGKMMSRLSNLFRTTRTLNEQEVGQLKGADFYAVLFQRLREREAVSDAQMQSLATERGENTYTSLKAANAPADRLTLGPPEKSDSDAKGVPMKLDLGTAAKTPAPAPAVN